MVTACGGDEKLCKSDTSDGIAVATSYRERRPKKVSAVKDTYF